MSTTVGRNSLIMAVGTAASRVTGQIRTIFLVGALGTTGIAANAYQAGAQIPQVIFNLLSTGIFNAVLVPQIVRTLKEKDAEERLSKLITLSIALLLAMTLLMMAGTPLLTALYLDSSWNPAQRALANAFTLWCMPQILFYGLYTVLGQILAAKGRFATYAWSSVGANVISCIGFGAFIVMFGNAGRQPMSFWTTDKVAFTAGAWTAGVAFQALVLFIPLMRCGIRYRPRWGVHGLGLRSMGQVAVWSIAMVVLNQLMGIVNSRVNTGAPTAGGDLYGIAGNASYQYAYTVYILPYSIIAVSITTAVFPRMSKAISEHRIADARADLSSSLRTTGLAMIFFTAAMAAMPVPLVKALIPSATVHGSVLISAPLLGLLVGLVPTSAFLLVQRAFYAYEDGRSPFLFAAVDNAVQLGLLLVALRLTTPRYWVLMVALSLSLSYIITFPWVFWLLRKRFGGRLDGRRIVTMHVKALVAGAVAYAAGALLNPVVTRMVGASVDGGRGHMNWGQSLVICAVVGIVVTAVYAAGLWVLRVDEFSSLVTSVLRRFGVKVPGVAGAATGTESGAVATTSVAATAGAGDAVSAATAGTAGEAALSGSAALSDGVAHSNARGYVTAQDGVAAQPRTAANRIGSETATAAFRSARRTAGNAARSAGNTAWSAAGSAAGAARAASGSAVSTAANAAVNIAATGATAAVKTAAAGAAQAAVAQAASQAGAAAAAAAMPASIAPVVSPAVRKAASAAAHLAGAGMNAAANATSAHATSVHDAPRGVPHGSAGTVANATANAVSAASHGSANAVSHTARHNSGRRTTAAAAPTIPTARMTATPLSQGVPSQHGESTLMNPHMGDTVIGRYTLVSLLRESTGLSAWIANDRMLAQSCQLFIINDVSILKQINDTASTLALANSRYCTPVLQLQHVGNVALVITEPDSGVSLTEYLRRSSGAVLSYDAIRSIIGQCTQAIRELLDTGLTHTALNTDTVRVSVNGVQFADTPVSPALADSCGVPESKDDSQEQVATRQLSALLYALLTRTPSSADMTFDIAALPADMPMEFRMICRRGLGLVENGETSVPMATLAEFSALLGGWEPFSQLAEHDIALPSVSGQPTISMVALRDTSQDTITELPKGLVTSTKLPDLAISEAGLAAGAEARFIEEQKREKQAFLAELPGDPPSSEIPAVAHDEIFEPDTAEPSKSLASLQSRVGQIMGSFGGAYGDNAPTGVTSTAEETAIEAPVPTFVTLPQSFPPAAKPRRTGSSAAAVPAEAYDGVAGGAAGAAGAGAAGGADAGAGAAGASPVGPTMAVPQGSPVVAANGTLDGDVDETMIGSISPMGGRTAAEMAGTAGAGAVSGMFPAAAAAAGQPVRIPPQRDTAGSSESLAALAAHSEQVAENRAAAQAGVAGAMPPSFAAGAGAGAGAGAAVSGADPNALPGSSKSRTRMTTPIDRRTLSAMSGGRSTAAGSTGQVPSVTARSARGAGAAGAGVRAGAGAGSAANEPDRFDPTVTVPLFGGDGPMPPVAPVMPPSFAPQQIHHVTPAGANGTGSPDEDLPNQPLWGQFKIKVITIIVALVVLIGGGVGAWFLLSGGIKGIGNGGSGNQEDLNNKEQIDNVPFGDNSSSSSSQAPTVQPHVIGAGEGDGIEVIDVTL
ncbi:murein biosynthesis integral membrane protein MurJ [Bifidobacterium leontopitheci]|uniref:Virulence factor protein n=1 Tax=Bifidobacterium leontopitheci TaxID=2650774 RepID=A0A6I1GFY8_9BIFI|nr:murein biosynthesis integral membrane protein MurJ [Bifidobacterium leontopitheci]KAB7789612.1 virulence factor protein [Bifidobacterium leontopitheci]